MKLEKLEKALLVEMKSSVLVPTKSRADQFRALIANGLIEHKGGNTYGPTELGLKRLNFKGGRPAGSKNKKKSKKK